MLINAIVMGLVFSVRAGDPAGPGSAEERAIPGPWTKTGGARARSASVASITEEEWGGVPPDGITGHSRPFGGSLPRSRSSIAQRDASQQPTAEDEMYSALADMLISRKQSDARLSQLRARRPGEPGQASESAQGEDLISALCCRVNQSLRKMMSSPFLKKIAHYEQLQLLDESAERALQGTVEGYITHGELRHALCSGLIEELMLKKEKMGGCFLELGGDELHREAVGGGTLLTRQGPERRPHEQAETCMSVARLIKHRHFLTQLIAALEKSLCTTKGKLKTLEEASRLVGEFSRNFLELKEALRARRLHEERSRIEGLATALKRRVKRVVLNSHFSLARKAEEFELIREDLAMALGRTAGEARGGPARGREKRVTWKL